jgi:hypothetical protein
MMMINDYDYGDDFHVTDNTVVRVMIRYETGQLLFGSDTVASTGPRENYYVRRKGAVRC